MQYIIASGVTDGGQRGKLPPWQAKFNSRPIIFRFWYSFGLQYVVVFVCFSDYFPVIWGVSLGINIRIHHHFSSFFPSVS